MKRLPALILLIAFPAYSIALAEDREYSEAELAQMLAPIALYPDSLLSQILVASTYPLEVVEAARWSQENPELDGGDAVAAVDHRDWDPSVKALTAFPRVLSRMNEDLTWTRNLGDAFLAQEEAVLATIQDLRKQAYEHGSLEAMEHARAYRDGNVVVIEPADPRIVYVPYYSPRVVYGSWRWYAHPPVYWRPPPAYVTGVRFVWVSGVYVPPRYFYTTCDWHRRQVVVIHHHPSSTVNRDREIHRSQRWQHDPGHRRGVRYRSDFLQRKYADSRRPEVRSERRTYLGHETIRDRLGRDGSLREPRSSHQRPPSSERAHSFRLREETRGETRTIRPRVNDRTFQPSTQTGTRQVPATLRERSGHPSENRNLREHRRTERPGDRSDWRERISQRPGNIRGDEVRRRQPQERRSNAEGTRRESARELPSVQSGDNNRGAGRRVGTPRSAPSTESNRRTATRRDYRQR